MNKRIRNKLRKKSLVRSRLILSKYQSAILDLTFNDPAFTRFLKSKLLLTTPRKS